MPRVYGWTHLYIQLITAVLASMLACESCDQYSAHLQRCEQDIMTRAITTKIQFIYEEQTQMAHSIEARQLERKRQRKRIHGSK